MQAMDWNPAMSDLIDLPHLRSLIGLRLRHQGRTCIVIEVLDDPPALILEQESGARLMPDHHGRPMEYAAPNHVVRVLSEDRSSLSDDWLDLELIE
jgi:hypothetical protein